MKLMAFALMAVAGTAVAAPRESYSAPGQLQSDDPGSAFAATFTGSDGGGAYTAVRFVVSGTLTSNAANTYASEVVLDVTPPGGAMQTVVLGVGNAYVTQAFSISTDLAGGPVSPAGEWQFAFRETFDDSAGVADSFIDGLVVTLDDAPVPPPASTDLGEIGGGDGSDVPVREVDAVIDTEGEVVWFKFSTAADALNGSTDYMDIDTFVPDDGPPVVGSINDSELGLYATDGTLLAIDDDSSGDLHSLLTFGSDAEENWRPPHGNGFGGDGFNGDLPAGEYYLAVGVYNMIFANGFAVTTAPVAGATTTGTIHVSFYTNLPGGTRGPICGAADLGGVGGVPGADDHLDNNDFVVFIDYFFAQNPLADQGSTGGVAGADGVYDNNDFVVFIDNFFVAPASCR
ncbi:MAG TPA: GC-type dockerin domain-anchored protein [Phycisphaerales bacterium]|nr:GC-type dockerin domain-anchored protein [Phycisphaerales bacterium]